MSRILAHLLNEPEHQLSSALQKLEDWCGYPSADVQFIAKNKLQTLDKIKQLNLDPHDTTAGELDQALAARFQVDEDRFSSLVGIKQADTGLEQTWKVIDAIADSDLHWEAWSLRQVSAKKLLRAVPPRRLMKTLRYRSIESLLRRENITEVFAAIPHTESTAYIHRLTQRISRLRPNDFVSKPIEIVVMPQLRWQSIITRPAVVQCLPLLGAIVINSWAPVARSSNLALYCLAAQAIDTVRVKCSSLKLNQVKAEFGDLVAKLFNGQTTAPLHLVSQPVAWHSLHRHWGKVESQNFPQSLGPHLQPEDMISKSPSELLALMDKQFAWWHRGIGALGELKGRTISFNIVDTAINYLAGSNGRRRSLRFGRQALWDELWKTYLGNPSVERFVLSRLDGSYLQPELLDINEAASQSISRQPGSVNWGTI